MIEGCYCALSMICIASIGVTSYFAIPHADQPKSGDKLTDRQYWHILGTMFGMIPGIFAVGILESIGVF